MSDSKVLLVEDDDLTQFMMGEMLDAFGVCFEVANDGQECIDMLAEDAGRFDAILLDIHMPKKSGLDAISEIRSHKNNPPRGMRVLALTADPAWHDKERVRKAGFNDVISKPVTMEKIRAALN